MSSLEELGQKVKAKYPGVYDDMPDAEVATKVKAKFPGSYDDYVAAAPNEPEEPSIGQKVLGTIRGTPGQVWGETERAAEAGIRSLLGGTSYHEARNKIRQQEGVPTRESEGFLATPQQQPILQKTNLQSMPMEALNVAGPPMDIKGGLVPIGATTPRTGWLPRTLEEASARKQFEGLKLPNSAVNLMHEQLQTPVGDVAVPAGRALRSLSEPITGQPVVGATTSAATNLQRLTRLEQASGSKIGEIISKVDQVAPDKAVDVEALLAKAQEQVPSGIVQQVLYGGGSSRRAGSMLSRLRDWFGEVGKEREPAQGELGLPQGQLQPGPETVPSYGPIGAEAELSPRVPNENAPAGQSVARQGELFSGGSFPEPNFEHRATASELWQFTKGLGDKIFNKASERYPGLDKGALMEKIKTDHDLAFMWNLRKVAAEQLEAAVAQHRPDLLSEFQASKDTFGKTQVFKPWLTDLYNAEATGKANEGSKAAYRHVAYAGAGAAAGGVTGGPVGALIGAGLGAFGGEKMHNIVQQHGDPFLARTLYLLSQRPSLPPAASGVATGGARPTAGAIARRALLTRALQGQIGGFHAR